MQHKGATPADLESEIKHLNEILHQRALTIDSQDRAIERYISRAEAAESLNATLSERVRVLEAALHSAIKVAQEAHKQWDADNDPRVGKLLMALAGYVKGYRADIDGIHSALTPSKEA